MADRVAQVRPARFIGQKAEPTLKDKSSALEVLDLEGVQDGGDILGGELRAKEETKAPVSREAGRRRKGGIRWG